MNENTSVNYTRESQQSLSNTNGKVQSLQDKTGATAQEIREAIEKVGFDREKVEQYLIKSNPGRN